MNIIFKIILHLFGNAVVVGSIYFAIHWGKLGQNPSLWRGIFSWFVIWGAIYYYQWYNNKLKEY